MHKNRIGLNMGPKNRTEALERTSGRAHMIVKYEKCKDKESAGKPGSVEDNHSSVMPVTGHL